MEDWKIENSEGLPNYINLKIEKAFQTISTSKITEPIKLVV